MHAQLPCRGSAGPCLAPTKPASPSTSLRAAHSSPPSTGRRSRLAGARERQPGRSAAAAACRAPLGSACVASGQGCTPAGRRGGPRGRAQLPRQPIWRQSANRPSTGQMRRAASAPWHAAPGEPSPPTARRKRQATMWCGGSGWRWVSMLVSACNLAGQCLPGTAGTRDGRRRQEILTLRAPRARRSPPATARIAHAISTTFSLPGPPATRFAACVIIQFFARGSGACGPQIGFSQCLEHLGRSPQDRGNYGSCPGGCRAAAHAVGVTATARSV